MVRTVREDEDPVELKEYRALFKKHVPFNLRGYLTAHMIKALVAGESSTAGRPAQERRGEPPSRRRRDAEPTAGGLRRLFVSVGRNRRVRPEDLTSLISSSVTVDRSQFGAIKILDSYSFIEVPEGVAEEAIAALSGTSFKGRRITVDFARSKS
jgi:hypothetical protein